MATKLTLSIDENTILRAKRFAKSHSTSLSVLVEQYFSYITSDQVQEADITSPLVSELTGVISVDPKFNIKDEYGKHLEDKYLK